MRHKSEVFLILAVSAFALAGVAAMGFHAQSDIWDDPHDLLIEPVTVVQPNVVQTTDDAGAWFQSIRMYCNPVDVDTRMRWQPAPGSAEGDMHKAACYALAGRVDQARSVIEGLPEGQRYQAAGVVFNAGHPAADAGDEVAAGPLMELVVEFWPNHYMALYHAGAASFERGDHARADDYLHRFLEEYSIEDGWRSNAESMLDVMTRM